MPKVAIRRATVRILLGNLAALCITLVAYRFHFNLSSATSVHLFLVTVIALRWGFLEASSVSLISVACLDYFFTQPTFAFYMTDSHDWVALLTFESVALIVSRLSNQVSRHARESEIHRTRLQKLYELSQSILLLDPQREIGQQLADLIHTNLEAKGVALWSSYGLRLCKSGACNDEELDSASFLEEQLEEASASSCRRVLRSGTRAIGILFLYGHNLDESSINASASLAALAIERARSFAAESSAEAARKSEQLRSAVLDGLAHAFKTPLTTIRSSSSGLIEMNTLVGTERKLVCLIDQQAQHLNELTTRLLRTAKIDGVDIKLKRKRADLAQLIKESVDDLSHELGSHPVTIQSSIQTPVQADEQLFKMALFQLLDNAAKYGSSGSAITVDIQQQPTEAVVSVRNEGSFIALEDRDKVFDRFYRCLDADHKASGTGIGLSVVTRIMEAHQGRVWITSDRVQGTTFFLALPCTVKEK